MLASILFSCLLYAAGGIANDIANDIGESTTKLVLSDDDIARLHSDFYSRFGSSVDQSPQNDHNNTDELQAFDHSGGEQEFTGLNDLFERIRLHGGLSDHGLDQETLDIISVLSRFTETESATANTDGISVAGADASVQQPPPRVS
jgi:hypothetical protein